LSISAAKAASAALPYLFLAIGEKF